MNDKRLKVGQNACNLGGINFTENAFIDFAREKFPKPQRSLDDWKDLVSEQGREKIEALIKEEILKNLGS